MVRPRKKRTKKTAHKTSLLFKLVLLASLVICGIGVLIAYAICVDRVDEFSNGWQYQNDWTPFWGAYWSYIEQLPRALYVSFLYFPHASFISLIFFPLLVFIIPLYDGYYFHDFSMLTMGWGPFLFGAFLFLWAGVLEQSSKVEKKDPLDLD